MAYSEVLKAGYFKAHCLELMNYVQQTGTELLITKHGKPVAKLAPVSSADKKPLWGMFKNRIETIGDTVSSTGESWNADR